MWEKKLLAKATGNSEEYWRGSSPLNTDLQVLLLDKTIRITSGGYSQSKKLDDLNSSVGYWHYQATAVDLSTKKKPRILILGFGGGTIGTLLKQKYLEAIIDGVEIDKKMVELGEKYLDLKTGDFNIFIDDANSFLKKTKEKYDYICVDLYIGSKTPPEIDSEKFYAEVKKLLKAKGKVSVNRIYERGGRLERLDLFNSGEKEYKKFLKLFSKLFKTTKVIEVPSHFFSRNYIFVGGI